MSSRYETREKIEAREWLFNEYSRITGNRFIPKGQYYWTLCGEQSNSESSEINQLCIKGYIKKKQFVGVDRDPRNIEFNKKLHSSATWFRGEFRTTFREHVDEYPPAIIYYDSLNSVDNDELGRSVRPVIMEAPPGTLICINGILNIRYRREKKREEIIKTLAKQYASFEDLDNEVIEVGTHPYKSYKKRSKMCMLLLQKKGEESDAAPSFEYTFKEKYRDLLEPTYLRRGEFVLTKKQKEILDGSVNRNYTITVAPPGWGKSVLIIALTLSRKKTQKSLIIAPQGHLTYFYAEPAKFRLKGKVLNWSPATRFSDRDCRNVAEELKKWLLSRPRVHNTATATHAGFVEVWKRCSKEERRKICKNLHIYVDECHHQGVEDEKNNSRPTNIGRYIDEAIRFKDKSFGVHLFTATPYRTDWLPLVDYKTYHDLFERFDVPFHEHFRSLGIKKVFFDYIFFNVNHAKKLIPQQVKKYRGRKQIIVFPPSNTGLRTDGDRVYKVIRSRIGALGEVCDLVDRKNQKYNKKDLFNKKNDDFYDIVIAVDMMNEGTDWPWASVLHILKTVNSIRVMSQLIGRVLRKYKGKTEINIHCYLPRSETKGLRIKCSDRVNAILVSLMMDDLFIPIALPIIGSHARPEYKPLYNIIGDANYAALKAEILRYAAQIELRGITDQDIIIKELREIGSNFYDKIKGGIEIGGSGKRINRTYFSNFAQFSYYKLIRQFLGNERKNIFDSLSESGFYDLSNFNFDEFREKFDLVFEKYIRGDFRIFGTKEGIDYFTFKEIENELKNIIARGELSKENEVVKDAVDKVAIEKELTDLSSIKISKPKYIELSKYQEDLKGRWVTVVASENDPLSIRGMTFISNFFARITKHDGSGIEAVCYGGRSLKPHGKSYILTYRNSQYAFDKGTWKALSKLNKVAALPEFSVSFKAEIPRDRIIP